MFMQTNFNLGQRSHGALILRQGIFLEYCLHFKSVITYYPAGTRVIVPIRPLRWYRLTDTITWVDGRRGRDRRSMVRRSANALVALGHGGQLLVVEPEGEGSPYLRMNMSARFTSLALVMVCRQRTSVMGSSGSCLFLAEVFLRS